MCRVVGWGGGADREESVAEGGRVFQCERIHESGLINQHGLILERSLRVRLPGGRCACCTIWRVGRIGGRPGPGPGPGIPHFEADSKVCRRLAALPALATGAVLCHALIRVPVLTTGPILCGALILRPTPVPLLGTGPIVLGGTVALGGAVALGGI